MAWRLRFYRRVHIAPGLSVNVSRSGPSLTAGIRGAHITVGRRGITRSLGIPGTGVFWTNRHGYHTGVHPALGSASNGLAAVVVLFVGVVGALLLIGLLVSAFQ